jgi:hypothetical protein
VRKTLWALVIGCAGLSYGQIPPASQDEQRPKDALARNAKLAAKLQKLLPQGPTIQQACDGFNQLGDCVSAIHVSQNLAIPLADLKAKVTGAGAEKLEKVVTRSKRASNKKP